MPIYESYVTLKIIMPQIYNIFSINPNFLLLFHIFFIIWRREKMVGIKKVIQLLMFCEAQERLVSRLFHTRWTRVFHSYGTTVSTVMERPWYSSIQLSTELPKLPKPFKPINLTLCSADCQLTTGDCRKSDRVDEDDWICWLIQVLILSYISQLR